MRRGSAWSWCGCSSFFFLMIRRPPRSTLFPTRRSSDLNQSRRQPAPVDDHLRLLILRFAEVHIHRAGHGQDRKSTRLNSSHSQISYAVFCLKKKNLAAHHLIACGEQLQRSVKGGEPRRE